MSAVRPRCFTPSGRFIWPSCGSTRLAEKFNAAAQLFQDARDDQGIALVDPPHRVPGPAERAARRRHQRL